jgi:hypothetical protein
VKKKRYIVVPRTEGIKETGIQTGKGKLTFGKKTAQWVDDPAIAREIDTQHGLKGSGDVWVAQDENLEWHAKHDEGTDGKSVGIHHYTFSGVDTSHFKVWVLKRGKLVRVTKAQALSKGYKIVATTKRRPDISQVRDATGGQEPEVIHGTNTI